MNKRMIFPLLLGFGGIAILVWLGFWQLQRMTWKQDAIDQIEAQMVGAPSGLPAIATPEEHKFLAVEITGSFEGPEIHVLASRKGYGPGYRIISAFVSGDRRVLVDRGFVPTPDKDAPRPTGREMTLTGNLHWPDEIDGFTPDPELENNIWFGRDVDVLARTLNTEPLLIIARSDTGDGVEAFPLDAANIPNNHLNYAITWFLMAIAWFGMTVALLSRIKRQSS